MHIVVRHLVGVPVLALDDDVLIILVQLQVDAAVEALARRARTAMLDPVALPPVVDGEQRFQLIPCVKGAA